MNIRPGLRRSPGVRSTGTFAMLRRMKPALAFAAFCLLAMTPLHAEPVSDPWLVRVNKALPLLGHRNWIVVVDAAYPLQTSPGIVTIDTGDSHENVVQGVLELLDEAKHVKPTVFTDSELRFIPEKNAPGISVYRDRLAKLLEKRSVQSIPHEQIIAKLDEAGKTFQVLVLKTTMVRPYTSVFFQLECGYWDAAKEKELREAMSKTASPAPGN